MKTELKYKEPLQMKRYKVLCTDAKTGKPRCVAIPAQDPQHALNVAIVLHCEDAIVLYEIKQPVKKETPG